jgi:elongator complex protein 3
MNILKQLLEEIKSGKIKTKKELAKRKRQLAKVEGGKLPENSKIFELAQGSVRENVRKLLQLKPTRTISGVAVVAVMSKPGPCPHGKCSYCPHVENVPESYTGKEPAARRGIANKFNPYKQVQNRLQQLYATGHLPEKVELIIMGGTFPSYSQGYQEDFVKKCILAMNKFPKDEPKSVPKLQDIQKANETAKIRCIGMTFETRPDYSTEKHADFMLKLGGTRVELGVQTVYDEIYKKVNRGHTVADVIHATKVLKDRGFKVLYHMMLGLPGSSPERDIAAFSEIFLNPDFQPDMLKIYPCLVIKGSEIYKDWKAGNYVPYNEKTAMDIIKEIKKSCPEWIRIMRIERDIPGTEIAAGIKSTNLRQLLGKTNCQCIRCREIGHRIARGISFDWDSVKLHEDIYKASGGEERFLQFTDKNGTLLGFLRLRLNKTETALVRELHVYGEQTPIGKKGEVQHHGYGQKLLHEAEKLAKQARKKKILVISGIGVREYYKKLGYSFDGIYMSKYL